MKTLYYFACTFFLCGSLLAQNYQENISRPVDSNVNFSGRETVTEIKTEQQMSLWLEKTLQPIVGNTIVLVDLQLEYPAAKTYGMKFDAPQSLPGLPVSKSRGFLADKVGDETILPTYIKQKKITIFVDKTISQNDVNFIQTKVSEWYNINTMRGDQLNIFRSEKSLLEATTTPDESTKAGFKFWQLLIALVVISAIMIFLLNNSMKNGFRYLIRSMDMASKQNSSALNSMMNSTTVANPQNTMSNLQLNQKKPLPVTIIENNNNGNGTTEQLDFSFVEDVPPKQIARLIYQESPEALGILLQKLPTEYGAEFFSQFPGQAETIIRMMFNPSKEHLSSLPALREKLFNRVNSIKKENLLNLDAVKTVTEIINESPPLTASQLIRFMGNIDPEKQKQIKSKVFLIDDINKLDDKIVEGLIRGINHDQLISFLASINEDLRMKFYKNMTSRAVSIIKEDIEIMGDLSPEEKDQSTKNILKMFRNALNKS